MLIRLGYDIGFNIPAPVTIVAMLHVHPSREPDLLEPDELHLDPAVPITSYIDTLAIAARGLWRPRDISN